MYHPVIQSGGDIALLIPLHANIGGFRGLLIQSCQRRTTAQILHNVPQLTGGRKKPAGSVLRRLVFTIRGIPGVGCLKGRMVDKMTIIVTDKLAVAIAADVVVVFLLRITFRHNLSIIGSPRCSSGDTFHGHHKTMHIPFAQFGLLGCADTVRVGLENDADVSCLHRSPV